MNHNHNSHNLFPIQVTKRLFKPSHAIKQSVLQEDLDTISGSPVFQSPSVTVRNPRKDLEGFHMTNDIDTLRKPLQYTFLNMSLNPYATGGYFDQYKMMQKLKND